MKLSVKYIKVILVVILLIISGKDAFGWSKTYYAKLTAVSKGKGTVYVSKTNSPSSQDIIYANQSSVDNSVDKSSGSGSAPPTADVDFYLFTQPYDGYSYDGWSENEDDTSYSTASKITVSATNNSDNESPTSKTVYCFFSPTPYTIILDAAGGTLPSGTKTEYEYKIDGNGEYTSITLPSSMSRDGYEFNCWKVTSAEGSWKYGNTPSGTISLDGEWGNATITAQWNLVEYTITLDAAGGKPESGTLTTVYKYKIDDTGTCTSITLPSPMSRDGYDFKGWIVNKDMSSGTWKNKEGTLSGEITLTGEWGDATITAQWEAKVYTITLDPDGGTLPSGTKTEYEYKIDGTGSDTVILLPNLEKDGYHFYGWIVSKDMSSGSWKSKEGPLSGGITLTDEWGDAKIIAQWGAIPGYVKITVEGQKDADYSIFDVYKEEVKLYSVAVSSSEVLVIPEVGKIKVEWHPNWPKLYTFNTVDPKEVHADETVEFKFTASPSGQTNVFETTLGF